MDRFPLVLKTIEADPRSMIWIFKADSFVSDIFGHLLSVAYSPVVYVDTAVEAVRTRISFHSLHIYSGAYVTRVGFVSKNILEIIMEKTLSDKNEPKILHTTSHPDGGRLESLCPALNPRVPGFTCCM